MAGSNVWIKSGVVRNLLGTTDVGVVAPGVGTWRFKDSPNATFQGVVSGTGAVSATIDIEYSNDGINALSTVGGTITLSGTTVASDGFTSSSPWKFVRANITAISGTGATAQIWMGV